MAIISQANGDPNIDPAANHGLAAAAFDASPQAQLVVDRNGMLAAFNLLARVLFGLTPADVGRPLQDLELSYRPLELRSVIAQVFEQGSPVHVRDVAWEALGLDVRYFDVHFTPMNGNGGPSAVSIAFVDVTGTHDLQLQLNRSKQDLETAYEELQSTNEELETTNEELQSTVEELETTNEELQSTNEELETMNEELQSTNEELQTINEDLRGRREDPNRASGFSESSLAGGRSGVVVVDRELHVIAWNHRSEDMWGLRADEIRGQNFLNLDIGLPMERLRGAIRASINGDSAFSEALVDATNRRGRPVACKVSVSPLVGGAKEICGAILLIEEQNEVQSG
jgi:two-component system CheB/CheR fusion protein